MTFYPQLIKRLKQPLDKKGVALFIVLTSMATLAIFLGEITYVAQINQKLAYDRLDQIKATALAKSGVRLALLRVRAYTELKKTVAGIAKSVGASANDVNSKVPKDMLEKIWSEPITVPFTGDISSLPTAAQDALTKFRKDSGMEGKLYISIRSQSSRFNLNSYLPTFFQPPTTSPTPKSGSASPSPTANPNPSGTPVAFSTDEARKLLTEQIKNTFTKKFEDDENFRDRYRNLKLEDIAEDMIAWNDISYDTNRTQSAPMGTYKRAPYYDVSELHYLPSIDDEIYDLLAPEYSASVQSGINVNLIKEPVLKALVPQMTAEERKKFFEDRDQPADASPAAAANAASNAGTTTASGGTGPFKEPKEFFDYLKNKVALLKSDSSIQEFKNNLIQRGIEIIVEESQFLIHIEATVQQTKRTIEALVMVVPDKPTKTSTNPNQPNSNTPAPPDVDPTTGFVAQKRSNLKVLQMRFL